MPVVIKLVRVVTYHEELPPMKFNDHLYGHVF